VECIGNRDILKFDTTAFLCSQRCPADVVLKSYDWAKEQRQNRNCIVCGNHSQIEKDVFDILLKGDQPIVLVLARGMKSRWEPGILNAINDDRLLIISPFDRKIKRVTRDTAEERNRIIMEMSDSVRIGYKSTNGQLERLLQEKKTNTI